MSGRPLAASLIVLGFLAAMAPAADDEVKVTGTGRAVYTDAELLKDYAPKPALVTRVTPTPKPRFPAIDIHCHWTLQQDPKLLLKAMDDTGVRAAVNLSGGYGSNLEHMLKRFHDAAPDRLLIFANLDFKQIDDPQFASTMCDFLQRARAGGASGLKIFKDLGLTLHDKSGKLLAIDDARLDPIWEKCSELKMPVLIHSGDPPPFFQPVDRFNERWMQLKRHPDWSFFGPEFPSYDEVLAQHLRMIRKHPNTVFISAHLANSGDDLKKLGEWLDSCPNLYTDFSGRVEELGRQPYAARKFLIRYQDRVMFGTDRYPGRLDQPRNSIYYRFLETDDEYFQPFEHPFAPSGDWRIYGLFLPDDVLRKIYSENATRALAGQLPSK
jgi:predicted TIM-barrel fold metal-dependent hydrolase